MITVFVAVNGVTYHGVASVLGPIRVLKLWDIVWNCLFVAYTNMVTHWQPHTFGLTVIALVSWQLNNLVFKRSPLLHVAGVQWPCCLALYNAHIH